VEGGCVCGQGKLFAMEEPVTPCKLVKMLLDGKREGGREGREERGREEERQG